MDLALAVELLPLEHFTNPGGAMAEPRAMWDGILHFFMGIARFFGITV